jgi:hypothetical protein
MSVMGLLAMGVAQAGVDDDTSAQSSPSPLMIAFGYAVLISNLYFVVQAGILGFAAVSEVHRRRLRKQFQRQREEYGDQHSIDRMEVPFALAGSLPSFSRELTTTDKVDHPSKLTAGLQVPLLHSSTEAPYHPLEADVIANPLARRRSQTDQPQPTLRY